MGGSTARERAKGGTPLVHAFIRGSAIDPDRYWWPVHGPRRTDEIAKSPRGRLFAAYE
jgi:hypothetical protein